ncbi:MAG: efflux transporter outer membrane subunit [Chlorobiales bacterium]|nr:efflux transporter outer membrane subunit [Chlorobiales bacterium]
MRITTGFLFWICLAFLLGGCAIGPNFERPAVQTPPAWKAEKLSSSVQPQGKPTASHDSLTNTLQPGKWWQIFGDPVLDSLQTQALRSNQDVQSGIARVEEARAQVRVSSSYLYPSIRLNPSFTRNHLPPNRPNASSTQAKDATLNTFDIPIDVSYELDIWGKLRRSIEFADGSYKATQADLEVVKLSVSSEVARIYFLIRSLDTETKILERTVAARKENLALTTSRHQAGMTTEFDLRQAETELANVESQLIEQLRSRAELEFSLALLCGESASAFTLASDTLKYVPPSIPAALPSELLSRRPDIARAELTVAATNAQIGTATASRLPRINLTASAGFQSANSDNLFEQDSRRWLIGVGVSIPIFEGFRNVAGQEAAEARLQRAVSDYKQTVLNAFREVESGLMNLKFRTEQSEVQARAVTASRQAASLVRERYRKGLVSYFDVVNTERSQLDAERTATQILGQRLIYTVQLIKALGGSWNSETILK